MAQTQSDVKYIQFPVLVGPDAGENSPMALEEVIRGYLAKGFSIVSTTVTNVTEKGFFVVHVLVK